MQLKLSRKAAVSASPGKVSGGITQAALRVGQGAHQREPLLLLGAEHPRPVTGRPPKADPMNSGVMTT